MSDKNRLVLELEPGLHRQLEERAAEKGVSLEELCIVALKRRVQQGEVVGPDAVLEELWDNEDDAVYDDL